MGDWTRLDVLTVVLMHDHPMVAESSHHDHKLKEPKLATKKTSRMQSIRDRMSAFSNALDGSGRVPQKNRPRREHTRQIIKTTRWDDFDWETTGRKDEQVDEGIKDLYMGDINDQDGRPGYLNAPELVRDVFMTFLKPVPVLHKKKEVIKDARLNGKFIEQMMELPEYERLHDQTMTDVPLATMATTIVFDALKEMIRLHREQVEESNRMREEWDGQPQDGGDGEKDDKEDWDEETWRPPSKGKGEGQDGGQSGDDQGASGQNSPGKNDGSNADQSGQSQFDKDQEPKDESDDGEDEQEQPSGGEEGGDQDSDEQQDEDEQEGEGQGGKGKGEGEDEEDESEGSGSGGDGDEVDEDAQLDNQDREWNDDYDEEDWDIESDWEQMLDGLDLGRLVNSALKKANDEIEELDDLRRGVGIEDAEWKMMDPSERLRIAERLNNPRMKQIADMVGRMKRFAMSQQAQKVIDAPHEIVDVEMGDDLRRVLRSEFAFLGRQETKIEFYRRYVEKQLLQYKEQGREDVGRGPIVCCIDNSGSMSGAPENWAKGVAEALRRICQEQGRDFHAIYFESNRHRERFDFPEGKGEFEKVLAFLSVSAAGGTEFDGVLTEALAKAQNMFDEKRQGKADIVFITDGEAFLDEGWINNFVTERDRVGCRIFGVYISAYDSSRSSAVKLLEKFCQQVIPVKALEVNDDAAATIFAQV